MLVSSNVTMQFGSKPLFENISVKFGGGNRYGLIGANGSGKSTFMKILGGDLEPTLGNVSLDPNERIGKLRQDQFAFEAFTVLDTVIMGHGELWEVKQERDRIYALAEMSEEDGYKVADLEVKYGEMDGYSAEARAGELLLGVGIPVEQHYGPMSEVAPGWKLRVLLAQALFSNPDILLLDEPTNHLDLASREWIEEAVEAFDGTLLFVSHDRYFVERFATRVLYLENGHLTDFIGSYSAFLDWRAKGGGALPEAVPAPAPKKKKAAVPTLDDVPKPPEKPKRTGGTKNLQKLLNTLEREISQLETQSSDLEQQMVDAASDSGKLLELMTEKEACDEKLAAKMDEWEAVAAELEELQ